MDSDAAEDKCGVCLGDGKLCSTQRGYYNVTDGDGRFILLREGCKEYLKNYQINVIFVF